MMVWKYSVEASGTRHWWLTIHPRISAAVSSRRIWGWRIGRSWTTGNGFDGFWRSWGFSLGWCYVSLIYGHTGYPCIDANNKGAFSL